MAGRNGRKDIIDLDSPERPVQGFEEFPETLQYPAEIAHPPEPDSFAGHSHAEIDALEDFPATQWFPSHLQASDSFRGCSIENAREIQAGGAGACIDAQEARSSTDCASTSRSSQAKAVSWQEDDVPATQFFPIGPDQEQARAWHSEGSTSANPAGAAVDKSSDWTPDEFPATQWFPTLSRDEMFDGGMYGGAAVVSGNELSAEDFPVTQFFPPSRESQTEVIPGTEGNETKSSEADFAAEEFPATQWFPSLVHEAIDSASAQPQHSMDSSQTRALCEDFPATQWFPTLVRDSDDVVGVSMAGEAATPQITTASHAGSPLVAVASEVVEDDMPATQWFPAHFPGQPESRESSMFVDCQLDERFPSDPHGQQECLADVATAMFPTSLAISYDDDDDYGFTDDLLTLRFSSDAAVSEQRHCDSDAAVSPQTLSNMSANRLEQLNQSSEQVAPFIRSPLLEGLTSSQGSSEVRQTAVQHEGVHVDAQALASVGGQAPAVNNEPTLELPPHMQREAPPGTLASWQHGITAHPNPALMSDTLVQVSHGFPEFSARQVAEACSSSSHPKCQNDSAAQLPPFLAEGPPAASSHNENPATPETVKDTDSDEDSKQQPSKAASALTHKGDRSRTVATPARSPARLLIQQCPEQALSELAASIAPSQPPSSKRQLRPHPASCYSCPALEPFDSDEDQDRSYAKLKKACSNRVNQEEKRHQLSSPTETMKRRCDTQADTVPKRRRLRGKQPPPVPNPYAASCLPALRYTLTSGGPAALTVSSGVFLTTGLMLSSRQLRLLANLGIRTVTDWTPQVTHLVADSFRRTIKLMCAVSAGIHIMDPAYIDACIAAGCLVEEEVYKLQDGLCEAAFARKVGLSAFSLQDAVQRARSHGPFLKDVFVLCAVSVENRQDLQLLVDAAGGHWLNHPPKPAATAKLAGSFTASGLPKLLQIGRVYDAELLREASCTQVLRLGAFRL